MIPKLTEYIIHTPTEKQLAFLWLTCRDAFYGGAVGGGKSEALLMAALQYVDIPGYAALLIRDTYANLSKPEGLMSRAQEWLASWITKGEIVWKEKTTTFHFLKYNSTLSFGYLDGPRDHFNYMSAAYQFVGIDEVVGIRKHQALFLFSRMRRLKNSKVPIRFRCASNPPLFEQVERGEWVKERYVNPKTRKPGTIFIPAKMQDNPYLDQNEYHETLRAGLDPITLRQLEEGDWEIQSTDRFFQVHNIRFADNYPADLVRDMVRRWDMAATETKRARTSNDDNGPAYTASVKGFILNDVFYVVDVYRGRWLPGDADKAIKNTAILDTVKTRITCEQEPGGTGKRDIYHLSNVLTGFSFQGIPSTGSKIQRARPLASWMNMGKVVFIRDDWNQDAINELRLFPDGKYKDIVDAMAGCFADCSIGVSDEHCSVFAAQSIQNQMSDEFSYIGE